MTRTCGDLDGKPCEFRDDCYNYEVASALGNADAGEPCLAVVALLEARAGAARWKNLVLDGIKQAGERVSDDLREKVKRMMSGEEDP